MNLMPPDDIAEQAEITEAILTLLDEREHSLKNGMIALAEILGTLCAVENFNSFEMSTLLRFLKSTYTNVLEHLNEKT